MIQSTKKTHDIVSSLHYIINQKNLLKPNQSMILAISGGQDSIILFFIFLQLKEQWDWRYQIIYCNHLWQKDSFYTILHLFKLAYLLNIPIVFTFTLQKVLTEQLARDWRALTFQRITEFYLVTTIILGHSKSDRVETGLFNLFRGSSTKGVSSLNWTSLVLKESIQNFFFLNKRSEWGIRSLAYAETGFYISVVDKKWLKKKKYFLGNKIKTKVLFFFLLLKVLNKFIGSLGFAVNTKQQKTIFLVEKITNRKKRKQIKIPKHVNLSSQFKCLPYDFSATCQTCLVDLQPIFLLTQYEKHLLKLKPMISSWEKGILSIEQGALIFLFLFLPNLSVKCFRPGVFCGLCNVCFVRNFHKMSEDLVIKRSLIFKNVSFKCNTRSCSGYVFNLSLQDSPYKQNSFNTMLSPTLCGPCGLFFNTKPDQNNLRLKKKHFGKKSFLRRFVETVLSQEALTKGQLLEAKAINLLKKLILRQGQSHSQCNSLSAERLNMVLIKMKTRRLNFLIFSYKRFKPISYKSKKVLVRPFLSFTRFDLKKLCNSWEIPLFPDQSNQKLKYQRNRIRKQILPLLRFLFNPQIDNTLNQFIEIINSEQNYMDFITCRIVKSLQYKKMGKNQSLFSVLPIPLRRKVIKQFLEEILKKPTRFFEIEKFLQKKQSKKYLTLLPSKPSSFHTPRGFCGLFLNTNDNWVPYWDLFFGAKYGQALAFCNRKQVEKQQVSSKIKKKDKKCQASKNKSEQGSFVWYPIPKYKKLKDFIWLIFSILVFFLFFYK